MDTITQPVGQQARETSAAGESPDAVDQREAELLNDLRESVSDLRSSAEKFAKLSDTFSPAEGEFVQGVFEPDVQKTLAELSRNWQAKPSRESGEDRRNIELALKHSYKESLLVVLFGLALSSVVAGVISQAVIGPIQKLRDAAHQLGHGEMDTRIAIHSKDELADLSGSFNLMADNLTNLMAERG